LYIKWIYEGRPAAAPEIDRIRPAKEDPVMRRILPIRASAE
jgi:hypothetical protein